MNSKEPDPSVPDSIEELAKTIAELKRALRRNDSLLRRVAQSRLYPLLAGAAGLAFLVCGALAQRGMDAAWADRGGVGRAALVAFFAFLGIAGLVKAVGSYRVLRRYSPGSYIALVKAILGGRASALFVCSLSSMAAGIYFLITKGQPWYIVPLLGLGMAFAAHALDILVDLVEYKVLGWSSLALAILSLFFVEAAPWLWAGLTLGLSFLAFGAAGLLRSRGRGRG